MPKDYHLDEVPVNDMRYNITQSALNKNGTLKSNVAVELPEIVIRGHKKGYKTVFDNNYLNPLTYYNPFPQIRKGIISGGRKAFNAYLDAIIPEDSYHNATEDFNYETALNKSPYGHERDNVINVHNYIAGQRNRLEMMGMVKDPETGGYFYPNPKYNPKTTTADRDKASWDQFVGNKVDESVYQYLRWCAQNSNLVNRSLGKPTQGDAWTRHGVYGDSAILVNPTVDKKGRMFVRNINSVNRDNAKYVNDNIENVNLQTGDIVDLAHRGSSYESVAWDKGDSNRANSHTGTILRVGPKKSQTYVLHYGGADKGMIAEPIGNLLGASLFKENYVTGIRRPGTRLNPYTDNYGKIVHNKTKDTNHPRLNRRLLKQ